MIGFELYTFFICILVFVALTLFFTFMIFCIGKQRIALIENGVLDEEILKNQRKKLERSTKKSGRILDAVSKTFSVFIFVLLCIVFLFTAVSANYGDGVVGKIPAIKVVSSTSMSEKYENNTYLFKNDLNNQLQLFDLVVLHQLPEAEDINLYDIVAYEHISGALLLHRIVGIEEPNEAHPGERYFLLQGDAVHYPDTFPVRYEQMRSIYDGIRIPNIGSFVFFMQSPAGTISLILILCCMLLMPIADGIVSKKELARYLFLISRAEEQVPPSDDLKAPVAPEPDSDADDTDDSEDLPDTAIDTKKQRAGALTMKQKLQKNDVARLRYLMIKPSIESIDGVRLIEGKTAYTYIKGNQPVAKITVNGKTLNVYFALNPDEFTETKYIFVNASEVKKYKNYPMRVKITSDRQMKWATELALILKKKMDL